MKKREYNGVKKMAEVQAAAEAYAACMQEGGVDADCKTAAQDAYETVSGADAAAWADEEAKVLKLAQGIIDGVEVEVRKKKQLGVDAHTSGTTCDTAVADALLAKVEEVQVTPATSGVKKEGLPQS